MSSASASDSLVLHAPDVQRARRAAQWRADAALLVVSALWGGTFVMVKDALAFAGPFTFLAVRFTLAALLMAPLLLAARRRTAWSRGLAARGALAGAALFAGYAFQTAGLQFTTPARAAFITGLGVVIVPLLSVLLFHARRPPPGVWAGVALATLGLALLSLGAELVGLLAPGAAPAPLPAETLAGDLLVLGCAVSFAFQIVLVGHFAPRFDAIALTLAQLAAAAVLCIVCALAFEQPRLEQVPPILPAAAFTGVFATVLAFTVQTRAQRFTTPTHTALIYSTEPVFGAIFAYLLVGELLAPLALLGCGLILAGMVLAQLAE